MDKKFLVYKSSAGSGKTYTLVKEYLMLVIEEPEKYRNILAITFTNKAADEMKQRVLSSLKSLSEVKIKEEQKLPLLKEIAILLNLSETEINSRAKNILTAILHNYSDFAIGTIDSFVHRIIKTFAHDLYLPMNFEVEMDENKLLEEATELLISRAGIDENLTKLLVEFTEFRTEDERSWHIETDIQKFALSLLKEEGQIYLEKLKNLSIAEFFSIIKKIYIYVSSFENSIRENADNADKLIKKYNINIESFFYGRSGIAKYFENIANAAFDKLKPNTYVLKTINENKWYSAKADAADKNLIDNIKDELVKCFNEIDNLIRKEYAKYILLQQIQQNIYPIALLNEIKKIIDDIKTENNILHISEFNKLISGIVLKEPVPFIYERTGEKFKHYLIDEFQDTSLLQWQNLLPLVDNSLAENNLNIIAGDGKQAIYRWRNGEVEQFTSLPKIPSKLMSSIIKEREQSLERNYKEVELNMNYRSKKNIVNFNNSLFKFIAENINDEYKKIYKDLSQKSKDNSVGGYVQVEFLNNDSEDETFDDIYFRRINEIIKQLKNDNFNLRDIAILCRSNNNASKTAQYLLKEGIDVVSSESLLLANSAVVNLIIACIQYIENTENKIAEAQIINYIIDNNKTSEQSFHNAYKSINYKENIAANLLEFFTNNRIEFNINKLTNLSVYDLCESLIRIFSLNVSKTVNPSLSFFINAVHEYSSRKTNNLKDFLTWWEEKKDKLSIIVPDEMDAVRILTIHKSKGLQFPVVIYPFATEKLKNTKDWLWVDIDEKEIPLMKTALIKNSEKLLDTIYSEQYNIESAKSYLDLINLLYVTLTRPEERIYVLTKNPGKDSSKKNSVPDIFCEYFKSIGTWSDTNFIYNAGKTEKHIPKERHLKNETIQLDKFISNDWKKKIIIHSLALDNSQIESIEVLRKHGNLIHNILSKIMYTDDLKNVLDTLENEGIIANAERTEVNKYLSTILYNDKIIKYFTKQEDVSIRTEAEIISKEGKIYRPDRLILDDKKAIIIEFKTGKEKEFHLTQVNEYGTLLAEAGYIEIEKILIYIDDKNTKIVNIK